MRNRYFFLLTMLACSAAQCAGTETDNPANPSALADFEASGCKKEQPLADSGIGQVTQPLVLGAEYDGLLCIAWERTSEGSLRVTLQNFNQTCGVEWSGNASVQTDGNVDLQLVNPQCAGALCGWCIYDATFDVRGVKDDSDTTVRFTVVDESGKACETGVDATGTKEYVATLPTKAASEGVVCRPAFRYAFLQQAQQLGTCGEHMTPCAADACVSCKAGLTCAALVPDDTRCLATCVADADCPLPGVLSCQEGTCRLAQTW